MHEMSLENWVDKLEALGSSQQIALYLESLGIKALPADAFNCAIAQAGEQQIDKFLSVTPSTICAFPTYADEPIEEVSIIGSPIQDFVSEFDQGYYPELVADA